MSGDSHEELFAELEAIAANPVQIATTILYESTAEYLDAVVQGAESSQAQSRAAAQVVGSKAQLMLSAAKIVGVEFADLYKTDRELVFDGIASTLFTQELMHVKTLRPYISRSDIDSAVYSKTTFRRLLRASFRHNTDLPTTEAFGLTSTHVAFKTTLGWLGLMDR